MGLSMFTVQRLIGDKAMALLRSARIVGTGINMRATPGVRPWNVLGQLNDGDFVTVLDATMYNAEGRAWYYIDSAFGPGFVAAEFLKLNTAPTVNPPKGDVLYSP